MILLESGEKAAKEVVLAVCQMRLPDFVLQTEILMSVNAIIRVPSGENVTENVTEGFIAGYSYDPYSYESYLSCRGPT
jgi:hypothetical protein